MKWLVPENELDRDQRDFINSLAQNKSNRWVEGFPGSGKTVLLLYAAKNICVKEPKASIVFIEFTHSLINMVEAAINELRSGNNFQEIPVQTYYEFCKGTELYDYILCDEVQDLPDRVLSAMHRKARKQVFVAGDLNQSIFIKDPQLGEPTCSPEAIGSILNIPRRDTLHVIHRLTPTIIKAVNAFMPSMNIMQGRYSMMKTDTQIRVWKASNQTMEADSIMKEALDSVRVDKSVGILFRHHANIENFVNAYLKQKRMPLWSVQKNKFGRPDYFILNNHLKSLNIPMQYVGNKYGSFSSEESTITLMTYHSAKGIDFDKVFLPFKNQVPDSMSDIEKTLLMVAMTRSRQDLYISYTTSLDRNVQAFLNVCKVVDLENINSKPLFGSNENGEDEFA